MRSGDSEFRFLEHTADLGIVVRAENRDTLFQGAAHAMMQIMLEGRSRMPARSIDLSLTGSDPADLLVRWLSEILYLVEVERLVVIDAAVAFPAPNRLRATLKVVPFDPAQHEILREIKAVTYHQLKVAQKDAGWEATIIFDL